MPSSTENVFNWVFQDIRQMFDKFGPVEEVTVLRDDNGVSRGISKYILEKILKFKCMQVWNNNHEWRQQISRLCLRHLLQPTNRDGCHQGDAPQPHNGGMLLPDCGQVCWHTEGQRAKKGDNIGLIQILIFFHRCNRSKQVFGVWAAQA